MKRLLFIPILFMATCCFSAWTVQPISCDDAANFLGCHISYSWVSDTCTANGVIPPSPSSCTYSGRYDVGTPAVPASTGTLISDVALATAAVTANQTGYGLFMSSYTAYTKTLLINACVGKPCQ